MDAELAELRRVEERLLRERSDVRVPHHSLQLCYSVIADGMGALGL